MRKLVNWSSYAAEGNAAGEINDEPSLTVPGMTLSLEELLRRHVRGEHVSVFTPVFSEDPGIPDGLERMDEMDRLDMSRALKQGIESERQRRSRLKSRDTSVTDVQYIRPPSEGTE